MKKKILDANILIEIYNANCKEILKKWSETLKYEICTTPQVLSEANVKGYFNDLLNKNILKIEQNSDPNKIQQLKLLNPVLSTQDCSIFLLTKNKNANSEYIFLTADKPLRDRLEKENCVVHGMIGIFEKLVKDNYYTPKEILYTFQNSLWDIRVYPISLLNTFKKKYGLK